MTADRALPRPLHLPWRLVALAFYIGINGFILLGEQASNYRYDWKLWASLPDAMLDGTIYNLDGRLDFAWSPVAAPFMALVGLTGPWPFAALHVVAVLLLRDRLLIVLMLTAWPFWSDAIGGNVLTFFVVSGILAIRGGHLAALANLGLLLLVPRPLAVPLAVWVLWRMPATRWPFAALFVVHALVVLASGYAEPWLTAMLSHGGDPPQNLGPTFLFGYAWLMVGIPLAAWLTWKDRPGWAGLAVSPYVLPAYLLLPLIDLRRAR